MPPQGDRSRPIVIGIVGGVGAGKSAAARALGALGCVVVDSDEGVRELLGRPEVREELVRWWGPSVARADGSIDRAAVARIVFADESERKRLEAHLHPMLKPARDRAIEAAAAVGAPAVVLDAPLLFEAGLDRECDAVVFVDAPEAVRAARLAGGRGWTPAELAKRESAQMPLEEKRRRADYVVSNDADVSVLSERIGGVFERIMQRFRPR